MRGRGRWILLVSVLTVVALVAGGATAAAFQSRGDDKTIEELTINDPALNPVQYSIKFVCGFVVSDLEAGVKPGNYATAINIHNHTDLLVQGGAQVALHYTNPLAPPPVQPTPQVKILPRLVREIDCNTLWAITGQPPHTYLKGMLYLGLPQPLPVTAVYTAQTTHNPDLLPDPGAGISIDVEQIVPIQAPIPLGSG